MADRMQRPIPPNPAKVGKRSVTLSWPVMGTMKYVEAAEKFMDDTASLHASIIEQGRKVQIAASGESKYGAMSAGEYIEWVLNKLEGEIDVNRES